MNIKQSFQWLTLIILLSINTIGAKPNGDFTGGGKIGPVCINQIGENCENDIIIDSFTRQRREKWSFQDCPSDNSHFTMKNKRGLPRLPEEIIRSKLFHFCS